MHGPYRITATPLLFMNTLPETGSSDVIRRQYRSRKGIDKIVEEMEQRLRSRFYPNRLTPVLDVRLKIEVYSFKTGETETLSRTISLDYREELAAQHEEALRAREDLLLRQQIQVIGVEEAARRALGRKASSCQEERQAVAGFIRQDEVSYFSFHSKGKHTWREDAKTTAIEEGNYVVVAEGLS